MGIQTEAPTLRLPGYGEFPYYPVAAEQFGNGREAGAWIAGVVHSIPEKCAHAEFPREFVDGAACAMVQHGLAVEAYSQSNDGSRRTLQVRSAHHRWEGDPAL